MIKRFDFSAEGDGPDYDAEMLQTADGDFVLYKDYANLLAAVNEMLPDYEKTTSAGADRIRKMLRMSG